MIYKAILLFIQKYLWSSFIKGRIRSKLWKIASIVIFIFLACALLASLVFNLTFEQSLWLVWSYVEDGIRVLPHLSF